METMHPLQIILEKCEYRVRSYSGRRMYGKECLGVDTERDGLGALVASVIMEIAGTPDDCYAPELVVEVQDAFRRIQHDQMGTGEIYYFPGVPYTEGDEEEDAPDTGDEGT